MATLHQVLSEVAMELVAAVTGLPARAGGLLRVAAALDWPATRIVQQSVKANGGALIAVFDRRLSKNSTRWKPTQLGQTIIPATLVATTSNSTIAPYATQNITLSSMVTLNDAVSCVLEATVNGIPVQAGTVVSGGATDTPVTMATMLATAIGANASMAKWVTASATGPSIAITSNYPFLQLRSYTGNGGTNLVEIGRRLRNIQIVIWTGTIEDRDTVANAIETTLTSIQTMRYPYQAGLALADGTSGYLEVLSDFNLDDATLSDAYRHDFIITVDHAVTTLDAVYAVLVPITQYQLSE